MSTYCIASATLTDPAKLQEYGQGAADALAKHGGRVIGKSTDLVAFDGTAPEAPLCVIIEFPDPDAAKAWHSDPALQDLHALRNASGQWDLYMLG